MADDNASQTHRVRHIADGAVHRWMRGVLEVETQGWGCHDITPDINLWLYSCRASDGVLLAMSAHTTASLIVQENADPDVQRDLIDHLSRLAPPDGPYRHQDEGPDDMPAHIKSAVTGHAAQCLIADGRLLLGRWQSLYLVEHRHSHRTRSVRLHYTGA